MDDLEESIEYIVKVQENKFSTLSKWENEVESLEGEEEDLNSPLDDEEIDAYYKKFIDFMQA